MPGLVAAAAAAVCALLVHEPVCTRARAPVKAGAHLWADSQGLSHPSQAGGSPCWCLMVEVLRAPARTGGVHALIWLIDRNITIEQAGTTGRQPGSAQFCLGVFSGKERALSLQDNALEMTTSSARKFLASHHKTPRHTLILKCLQRYRRVLGRILSQSSFWKHLARSQGLHPLPLLHARTDLPAAEWERNAAGRQLQRMVSLNLN